ncbi:MAG: hypothetical protein WAX89_06945 [Alphaproteobacteria bacterium]
MTHRKTLTTKDALSLLEEQLNALPRLGGTDLIITPLMATIWQNIAEDLRTAQSLDTTIRGSFQKVRRMIEEGVNLEDAYILLPHDTSAMIRARLGLIPPQVAEDMLADALARKKP